MPRFSLRISEDLLNAIAASAEANHRKRTDEIARLVEQGLIYDSMLLKERARQIRRMKELEKAVPKEPAAPARSGSDGR